MRIYPIAAGFAGLSLVAACGDGTSFANDDRVVAGTAAFSDDVYTVTQGDTEVALDIADSVVISGQRAWLAAGDRAQAYQSDNVLAVGGVQETGVPFAGITGTVAPAPVSDVTFEGGFAVLSGADEYTPGSLILNFDLASGALTNDGGLLTVDATATDDGLSGTVAFDGESADMLGNFFGTDEVVGAFTGTNIGGVLYGTQQ